MSDRPALFWFRDDLRLADNAGLAAAVTAGRPVVCVFVLDEESPGVRPLGGALRWWLDKSLRALMASIAERGGRLVLRRGPAADVIDQLVTETHAAAVYWNRRYGPARETDAAIKAALRARGTEAYSGNASYLVEPFALKTGSGEGYKVFTPYWKSLQASYLPPSPLAAPTALHGPAGIASDSLDAWALHPTRPDWSAGLAATWTPGEAGAHQRLDDFLARDAGYASNRDRPDIEATSRLSPHLHFGEIGPAQIWRATQAAEAGGAISALDARKFLSEVGWREFSAHLLFHDPQMIRLSWRRRFDDLDWRAGDAAELDAWRRGQTGYPLVDAGMRQLWETGWMHNRVRMIVASFLTKDLLVH